MRAYARKLSGDEDLWGVVGLLHDFDYEKYPSIEDHPYRGNEILKERGYSDEIRRAIMSHAEYSAVSRDSAMEKALFACDELAGFITACALVKPGKSLAEVEVAADPCDVLELRAQGEALRAALGALTPDERQAIETTFFAGLRTPKPRSG